MLEFAADYGLFVLKVATIVAAIAVIIVAAAGKRVQAETLDVESLNDKYRDLALSLRRALAGKQARKKLDKEEKARHKAEAKADRDRPRSFVIDFKGDLKASAVQSLREEVTAILDVAGEDDEVVVRLENSGGAVHEHGLAAAQLVRLRNDKLKLIVAIDKVAASGGYLMACVADRVVAAPFAIVGSIGVIAQIPNFNRALETYGVDFEEATAGKYKRTVTMFGKNSDEDRAKLRADLEDVHELFKSVVGRYRPTLDLGKVATGEYWYGTRALELGLVDELSTSDELLAGSSRERDLYRIRFRVKKGLKDRLASGVETLLERADIATWRRRFESRLPR